LNCEPWNGVFAQQLLAEESVTRPMFEAITVSQFKPLVLAVPGLHRPRLQGENAAGAGARRELHDDVRQPGQPPGREPQPVLCRCAPDIIGADIEKSYSKDGVEYSYEEMGSSRRTPGT
jgi:hypothetical protein